MRTAIFALSASLAIPTFAKLPPAPESSKAAAVEAAAKAAWTDKVGAYQLCLVTDRLAEAYRRDMNAKGKTIAGHSAVPPCVDPGPYVTPVAGKPLEAAGAHSPPGTATSPPSTNATAAELQGSKK